MSQAQPPDEADDHSHEIAPAQLFAVFARERCQLAVAYLAQKPTAIPLGDLAEYIAIEEGEPTTERYERVCTDLYHSHLPYMDRLGLIHYDETSELVELSVSRSLTAPYLRLAGRIDA